MMTTLGGPEGAEEVDWQASKRAQPMSRKNRVAVICKMSWNNGAYLKIKKDEGDSRTIRTKEGLGESKDLWEFKQGKNMQH